MGRSFILLRIGALLCYFGGGLAVWIDAKFSQEWVRQATNADRIMPGLSISIAFIMAVCVSSFGAIVTAPYSWQIIYGQSQRLASIANKNERLLTVLGFMLLSGFLLAAFVASYTFDIISTNYATKNMMLAVAIVCSGDICFLLANILWIMSQFARVSQGEMTASASYGRQTVSDSNGRFK